MEILEILPFFIEVNIHRTNVNATTTGLRRQAELSYQSSPPFFRRPCGAGSSSVPGSFGTASLLSLEQPVSFRECISSKMVSKFKMSSFTSKGTSVSKRSGLVFLQLPHKQLLHSRRQILGAKHLVGFSPWSFKSFYCNNTWRHKGRL